MMNMIDFWLNILLKVREIQILYARYIARATFGYMVKLLVLLVRVNCSVEFVVGLNSRNSEKNQ